jgi:hypothetical protein
MRTYSNYLSNWQSLTGNTTSTNQTLGLTLINDALRYLATKFYFNERTYVVPGGTVAQQQAYQLPFNFEQIENLTVLVGGFLWQPKAAASRKHFDMLNLIPYYSDYPQYYYIWNGQVNLWPIPASAASVITINYKIRVKDIALADFNTGTVTATAASTTISHSATGFYPQMVGQWIKLTPTSSASTSGDGQWYQIATYNSTSSISLYNAYTGSSVIGAAFTIGDVPILPEDYQDLPMYRALEIYFTSIVPDPNRAKMYKGMYDEGYGWLNDKYSNKEYSPVLTDTDSPVFNPNLFPRNLS